MKKIKFLIELHKEGRLELVESSHEIRDSYIKKGKSSLESAKILLKFNKIEESVSLSYYAMYNSLLALLFQCGIKSENHSASILLLNELFNQKKLFQIISFGKKERIDKQYYVDFKTNKEEVQNMIKKAEEFINSIRTIMGSITNEKIKEYKTTLEKSLK